MDTASEMIATLMARRDGLGFLFGGAGLFALIEDLGDSTHDAPDATNHKACDLQGARRILHVKERNALLTS